MSFGWSIGDIVSSITLIAKISVALKESGGAKSDYQESIEFLFGLEATLQNLRTIAPVLLPSSQESILQVEIEKVVKPISAFFERVQKLDGSLGKESKKNAWRTAPRKVQWALQVSKEVKALRENISVPIASLNILLQSQVLLAMSNLHERLPREIADRLASCLDQSTSISSNLREEIVSLKASVKNYEESQGSMKHDILAALDRESYASSAMSSELERLPQQISRNRSKTSNERIPNPGADSRFEEMMVEQSRDLKMICGSINTMAECRKDSWNKSTEVTPSSQAVFQELKSTFCKCICLLALSIQQLFKEAMLFLGPQFLVFLLVFKQIGMQAPRLLLGDRFLFEDVLGRQKYLPVEFFQHYNVFNSFLQESFTGLPGQRYVSKLQFRLTDGNSTVLSSKVWQQTVVQRSKIAMTVVLDAVDDELVDGLACPRCSTLEVYAKPDTSIDCSSCKMQYRTATFQVQDHTNDAKTKVQQTEPTEITPSAPGPSMPTENITSETRNDATEFGEARTIDMNTYPPNQELPVAQTKQYPTWKLPWDEEELKHFKRVQIPEFDSQKRMSSTSTLAVISAAVSNLVAKLSVPADLVQRIPDIEKFMREVIILADRLFEVSDFAYAIVLSTQEAYSDPDWKVRLSSDARQRIENLVLQSRLIFKETMIFYHEIKNLTYEAVMKKASTRKLFVLQQLDLTNELNSMLSELASIDVAWRRGGSLRSRSIKESVVGKYQDEELPDETAGVATCLKITHEYIFLALDDGRIFIFGHDSNLLKILSGHTLGVWALAMYEDTLISGGADRDVRIWDVVSGECRHILRGHTATIRCLEYSPTSYPYMRPLVLSGSRDTTLRVWDPDSGVCRSTLVGHTASVRCMAVLGDRIVTGSYDASAKIWSVDEGRCLRTLTGHSSQIYCIAMDESRVVTGSLDTSIRVWDPYTGECQAILYGHTSLVGRIQLRNDTLVSGGSDGTIRTWSLKTMAPIHKLYAADNSIIGIEFDHSRMISGSSDGSVKVWNTATGELIRELGERSDRVWQVSMSEDMAVVVCLREEMICLEVWSFASWKKRASKLKFKLKWSRQKRLQESLDKKEFIAAQKEADQMIEPVINPQMSREDLGTLNRRKAYAETIRR